MTNLKIGYPHDSTAGHDLAAQRHALTALGADLKRIHIDHGITGTNQEQPGLRETLAACCSRDTLILSKFDRLTRSVPDARDNADELTSCGVRLNAEDVCTTPSTRSDE